MFCYFVVFVEKYKKIVRVEKKFESKTTKIVFFTNFEPIFRVEGNFLRLREYRNRFLA